MQKQQLGTSDLLITPLGFGTWAIGGSGWQYAWGPQDDKDSIAAIHRALDYGINWIDTAAVYGLGHAEEVIAQALRGRAEKPYIFTKCTRLWNDKGEVYGHMKTQSIRQEVEASLRRLNVDVIDLYQLHWPDPEEDIEEAWTTLSELKEEQKVRHIGVSNFSVEQMRRIQVINPITSLQPPYSLLNRTIEADILSFCQQHSIGIIVYSPMMSGLLSGAMTHERVKLLPEDDWRRLHPEFQEPRLSRNLDLVGLLRRIGDTHGRTPAEVAIAWTLRHSAVNAAIVGGRRPDQVDGFIGAAEFRLSDEELEQIEQFLQNT
jgi:aryl-alcohol dehydrogenase-like predicted oxidoreductase